MFVIVDQTAEAANETGSFRVAIVAGRRLFERTGDGGNGCTGVCGFKECDEELSKVSRPGMTGLVAGDRF
jgi:hypothetical protein